MCSNVDDFNKRNLFLTAKLLKQGYRYHEIRKAFSKLYHRHSELIVKYNIGLNTLMQQGISEPILYGVLAYKFKRINGKPNFSDQFKKIVKRYIRLSKPEFYGDLVYKLKKIVGSNNFSAQFIKIISYYKKIGYNINVLQQTACLVVNPITVGNLAFFFNCTPASDFMVVPT